MKTLILSFFVFNENQKFVERTGILKYDDAHIDECVDLVQLMERYFGIEFAEKHHHDFQYFSRYASLFYAGDDLNYTVRIN